MRRFATAEAQGDKEMRATREFARAVRGGRRDDRGLFVYWNRKSGGVLFRNRREDAARRVARNEARRRCELVRRHPQLCAPRGTARRAVSRVLAALRA